MARNWAKNKMRNNLWPRSVLGAPQFFGRQQKYQEVWHLHSAVAVMDAGSFLPTVKHDRGPKDLSKYRGVTSRESKQGVRKWIAQQRIPKTATANARTQHIGIFDTETEAGSAWTAWVHRTGNLHLLDEEAAARVPAADSKWWNLFY